MLSLQVGVMDWPVFLPDNRGSAWTKKTPHINSSLAYRQRCVSLKPTAMCQPEVAPIEAETEHVWQKQYCYSFQHAYKKLYEKIVSLLQQSNIYTVYIKYIYKLFSIFHSVLIILFILNIQLY